MISVTEGPREGSWLLYLLVWWAILAVSCGLNMLVSDSEAAGPFTRLFVQGAQVTLGFRLTLLQYDLILI